MAEPQILASGGLVFRSNGSKTEVLVVHRPSYDDWSLPKGKRESGETPEETAVREVEEETGVRARIVGHIDDVRYKVGNGRTKEVAYYAMKPLRSDPFKPNSEVDRIEWLTRKKAVARLSYDFDRTLVADATFGVWRRTGTIWFVRHAAAGDRSDWRGDDERRPLTKKGRRQSTSIADVLAPMAVERIISSPYLRCVETVRPLADRLGLQVEEHEALAEGAGSMATDLIASLAGTNAVLCSHGDVIPAAIDRLARSGTKLKSKTGVLDCQKGSTWELTIENGTVDRGLYHPPPPA